MARSLINPLIPDRRRPLPVFAVPILITLAVLLLQVRWNPAVEPMRPDSGLFAYAGVELADGADLYRDIWDNKPPGIFAINSLAVSLGGSSPWSLLAASALAVLLAAAGVFLTMYLAASQTAAALSTAIFLLVVHHPSYYQGGNLTELYALVPNALILLALAFYLRRSYRAYPALLGGLTALAFLLKPNLISVGAATILLTVFYLLRTGQRSHITSAIGVAAFSFAGLLAPVGIYFAVKGSLTALIQAVFTSTLAYSGETLSVRSLYGTARKLTLEQPLAPLVGMAFLTAPLIALSIWRRAKNTPGARPRKTDHVLPAWVWLATAALLALPLQVISAAATGRNFGHYFLDPILTLSIIAGSLFCCFRRSERGPWYWPAVSVATFLSGAIVLSTLPAVLPSARDLSSFPQQAAAGDYFEPAVHDYLLENTAPGDAVLVWSNHPSINFLTGRRSPSAYVNVEYVLDPNPDGMQRFEQFLRDLQEEKPGLIVAQPQSSAGIPYFADGNDAFCPNCQPEVRQRMELLQDFVFENYEQTAKIADWVVWALKE